MNTMIETASAVRYTVIPRLGTQLAVKVEPRAECMLYPQGQYEPACGLRLYADQEGIVRFQIRPAGECDELSRVVLECNAHGKVTHHPIEFRVGKPTDKMPLPTQENRVLKPKDALIRPALSEGELRRVSDEELIQRGYPVRPNPEEAPNAFLTWRRSVMIPMTFVPPHPVPRRDIIRHRKKRKIDLATASTAENSSNWSGFALRGVTGAYDWVTGTWHVPTVSGETSASSDSLVWVGLDGDGTTDLVQAGTGQNNTVMNLPGVPFPISFSTYFAWSEFLPQQPTLQQLTGFAINSGDEIFVEVWVGFAGSGPILSGFFGVMWLSNLTTSAFTSVYTPRSNTVVGGSEAEWIMERATFGKSLGDLADYGSAVLYNAYARRSNSPRHKGYVPYQSDTNRQITMVNGAKTLSAVTPIDPHSMRFTWNAFS
jgi:hypothetical protein